MSIFYLLPPRATLGECFARYLERLLPGVAIEPAAWPQLAEEITALTAGCSDAFLVHREDLPEDEEPARALADGFGAEPGDEVVELQAAGKLGEWHITRWPIPANRAAA